MVELAAPPVVYALALVPALLWGFAPVLSKRGMEGGGSSLQASLVVVVVDTAVFWVALVALDGVPLGSPEPGALALFAVAGVIGTALGRIAAFAGVLRVGASVNSAAISTRPLFATGFAVGLIGERVTPPTLAGVAVLTVGLVVLGLSEGGNLRGWSLPDLGFPLLAAGSFGLGNAIRRFGLQVTDLTTLEAVAVNETGALLGLLAFGLARHRGDVLAAPRRTYAYFAGSGLLTAGALLGLFAAFDHPQGRVAVVDSLAATAPLFTAVFAYFLLGEFERVTRRVVLAAGLIVVGAALITVG